MLKPRVTCKVLVKIFVGTGVEPYTRFVIACEAYVPYSTVENYGAPVGGLVSASGSYAPDADITCKINRCKQS